MDFDLGSRFFLHFGIAHYMVHMAVGIDNVSYYKPIAFG